jgi:DNA repair photolyase
MSKVIINPTSCKTALNKTGIPGYRYCLNPYTGCSHGCLYCYADTVLRFASRFGRWGEFVAAKVNFPEVLRRELKRKRSLTGRVLLGTVTDAYQPAEEKFRLTRASLEVLAEEQPDVEIDLLTKSGLVVRDLDVLKKLKYCSIGFTITTLEDRVAAVLGPGASPPAVRLRAARRLAGEGLYVWAFIAPFIPGVSDAPGVLEGLISGLKEAGVKAVYLDSLNPYPASISRLKAACRGRLPRVLASLERYLADPRGYLKTLSGKLAALSSEYGYHLRI